MAPATLPVLRAEPPIRDRKESRARIALNQDAATLREVASNIELPHTAHADHAPDISAFLQRRLAFTTLTIGSEPPAQETLPAGFTADFDAFKNQLSVATIHEGEDGTPYLLPQPGATPVKYYHVEEDLALNELELTVFHQQSLKLAQLASQPRGARPAFATSFTSADPSISRLDQAPLRAQTEQNKVVRWVPGSTLSYCILKWTFDGNADRYNLVKTNIEQACRDWEATCNIHFQHIDSLDASPRGTVFPVDANGKRKVLFVVANLDIGTTIAQSFFPNDPISRRLLFVDPDEYFNTTIDKIGILRHELGHILGFRHEHISPDAPVWNSDFCATESAANSLPITTYERASVMHYPCAAQLQDGPIPANMRLEITELDGIGARAIYGSSAGHPAGQPAGLPTGNFPFRDFDPTP